MRDLFAPLEVKPETWRETSGLYQGQMVRPLKRVGDRKDSAGEHVWVEVLDGKGSAGTLRQGTPRKANYRFRTPMRDLTAEQRSIALTVPNISERW